MMLSNRYHLPLAVIGGALLWLSWPPLPFTFLIFVALVPFLLLSDLYPSASGKAAGRRYFLLLFIGFLLWNVATTWWVGKASFWGGVFANLANAALMLLPWKLYRMNKHANGRVLGYIALMAAWMSFEYLHLRWEFTWPWLNLGNVFAAQHKWVQWYDTTGTFGGTLWIWMVNILAYEAIRPIILPHTGSYAPGRFAFFQNRLFRLSLPLFLVVIPILVSLNIYNNYTPEGEPIAVTVLQPNFDPYTQKFSMPYGKMMDKMVAASEAAIRPETEYLVWPETAIPEPVWLDRIDRAVPLRKLEILRDSFPHITTIVGINGFMRYDAPEDRTVTTRTLINERFNDTLWYDAFNSAIQMQYDEPTVWYHKSKLVPGAERMPYPQVLKFLDVFTISLGGVSGTYGTQKERTVFTNSKGHSVATAICYESIFGEYVTRYIKNSAGLIFIITNDGWWGDTGGYKQHCAYARLRAIQNRRDIARSANTGISCFIDQRGDIRQATGWMEDAVISDTLLYNTNKTFYTLNGDVIGRTSVWLLVLFTLMAFVKARSSDMLPRKKIGYGISSYL